MSLSGNLGFVSLDEVLRLLTRSGQQGSVDVRGEQIRGRVFITKGGIGLATTSDDEGMKRHLIKSGLADSDDLGGQESIAPLVEKSGGAIVELLREMTVESIYQLGLNGESFEVYEGVNSPYVSPKAFELEELLADSKQRLTDWAEVSRVVDDLHASLGFVRDLGEREEIMVDRESWMVLSELGAGASVAEIADELGTTEFWAARIASRLISKDLVSMETTDEPTEVVETPEAHDAVEAVEAEPIFEAPSEPVEDSAPEWDFSSQTDDDSEEDVDPNESWWEEPQDETEEVTEDAPSEMPVAEFDQEEVTDEVETAEDDTAEMPTVGAEASEESDSDDTEDTDDSDEVEEDTEAFLEKVFSELETPEEPEEEGYGLLRRRRMGAIRDASNDA